MFILIDLDKFFKNIDNHFACQYCINKYEFNDSPQYLGCKYNQEISLRIKQNKFKKAKKKDNK